MTERGWADQVQVLLQRQNLAMQRLEDLLARLVDRQETPHPNLNDTGSVGRGG